MATSDETQSMCTCATSENSTCMLSIEECLMLPIRALYQIWTLLHSFSKASTFCKMKIKDIETTVSTQLRVSKQTSCTISEMLWEITGGEKHSYM